MSATPLCDTVLSTPIEVPPGLGSALRNVERGARAARARLQNAVAAGGAPVPAVEDALERLARFLDDPRHSPLRRALRRPLRQVSLGTPGWRRLESAWRAVVLRADAAARLQGTVDELQAEVSRIEAQFAAALPYWTRLLLERERVTAPDVARIRREDARKALRERLRRVEAELAHLQAHLPPGHDLAGLLVSDHWPEGVSPGELLAAATLRLAERAGAGTAGGRVPRLRAVAARHLHWLGAAGGWSGGTSQPVHTVAEQLANAALSASGVSEWHDDGPLWAGLVATASDVLHVPRRREAWQPRPAVPEATQEAADWGATHFALPLSHDYVLLTPETSSPVRVSSRRVALDAAVECVVFSGPAGFETVAETARDAGPLFAGFTADPGWYRTERNARLTLLARAGRLWLARVDARGEVSRAETAAWSSSAPRDARLRVLLDGVSAPPLLPVPVGTPSAPLAEVGGIVLREVEAPFAAHRRAWLKTADAESHGRLDAEHAFFRRMARDRDAVGLRPLGRGWVERPRAEGYLYAQPFAFIAGESPALARWMSANPVMFACATARLCTRLTGIGLGLGFFHHAALAFRLAWSTSGIARPAALVTMAPFAAPLGQPYLRDLVEVPLFPGLGVHLLHPDVLQGAVATPETEAQSCALFALDLLARKRLPAGTRSFEEVAALAIESPADYFAPLEAAARFGAALLDGTRARSLIESLARVGEDAPPA